MAYLRYDRMCNFGLLGDNIRLEAKVTKTCAAGVWCTWYLNHGRVRVNRLSALAGGLADRVNCN